jgi:hypothetical protein
MHTGIAELAREELTAADNILNLVNVLLQQQKCGRTLRQWLAVP